MERLKIVTQLALLIALLALVAAGAGVFWQGSGESYEFTSLRGETVTYLIDEGRFIALPDNPGQVESVYLVAPEQDAAAQNAIGPKPPASSTAPK